MSKSDDLFMATDPVKTALAGYGSPRVPMGDSATKASYPSAHPVVGKLRPKGANPDEQVGAGTAGGRKGVRLGAQYRITAKMPEIMEIAVPTMANARIIPATHSGGKGFWSQAAGL